MLACEEEPGLGNGGLGRLAACYLDSLATLERPAIGYGIRYEFGIFDQEIHDGWQVEKTDNWLANGNPWEIAKPDVNYLVNWGGHAEHYADEPATTASAGCRAGSLKGVAYDTPIQGYGVNTCNVLTLWSARAVESFALGRLQHRRLLQGRRGRGQLRDHHQGAVPERRARGGQAAAPAAAVLLRVVLAAARPAHHGRSSRCCPSATCPSDSPSSSTTPTRRSASPS